MVTNAETPVETFSQLLVRFGFTDVTIQFLVEQGIDSAKSFATYPFNQLHMTYNNLSSIIRGENLKRSHFPRVDGDPPTEMIALPLSAW